MRYPKPTDTLDGVTNTKETYSNYEIWKKDNQRALVDVFNTERKIHLLYDMPTNENTNKQWLALLTSDVDWEVI